MTLILFGLACAVVGACLGLLTTAFMFGSARGDDDVKRTWRDGTDD
jgi:hypothetical protein